MIHVIGLLLHRNSVGRDTKATGPTTPLLDLDGITHTEIVSGVSVGIC